MTTGLVARLRLAVVLGAGGVALALAFPRTAWDLAAWIALVPLLVAAARAQPRQALAWGWLFGLVFFLVLLRWLNFTFRVYSAIPWAITWLPTALLAAYCGLFIGGVAWAVSWIGARLSIGAGLAAAPFLWVGAEWLRGHLFGGFPWGSLGYSQYRQLAVLQLAELGGVHLVSLVLVAVNAALAGLVLLAWRQALAGAAVAAALVAGTVVFGTARLDGASAAAALRICSSVTSVSRRGISSANDASPRCCSVWPWASRASTGAPRSSSQATISGLCFQAATCSGVVP